MPSFQISIEPNRRAAARFVGQVRRALQKAFIDEQKKSGLSQADIARALGVNRSVINRELKGFKDITLGRVAELAWSMGKRPHFVLEEANLNKLANYQIVPSPNQATLSANAINPLSGPQPSNLQFPVIPLAG